MPNDGNRSALAPGRATGRSIEVGSDVWRAICHAPGSQAGYRASRFMVYIAITAEGPIDAEAIAAMTNLETSHAARCCAWLVKEGLAREVSDGVFAYIYDLSMVNGLSLSLNDLENRARADCAEIAPVTTLLRWEPTATVAASPFLEPAVRLCELMGQQLEDRGVRGGATASAHTRAWVQPMELLLRLDLDPQHHERSPEERVTATLNWLHRASDDVATFWQGVVLSPANLRKHWAKMAAQVAALRRRQQGGRLAGLAEATGADKIIAAELAKRGIT